MCSLLLFVRLSHTTAPVPTTKRPGTGAVRCAVYNMRQGTTFRGQIAHRVCNPHTALLGTAAFTQHRRLQNSWRPQLACCSSRQPAGDDAPSPAPGSPQDVMFKLASELGVRAQYAPADEDDEDEDWDEVVSDLGNPWAMEPAQVWDPEDLAPVPASSSTASAYDSSGIRTITTEELAQAQGQAPQASSSGGVLLLDVRELHEHSEGHIPGSTHMPVRLLTAAAAESLRSAATLVLVGSGDHRAAQAYVRLTKVYGMSNVVLYEGGVAGWAAAGGALAAGSGVTTL